MTEGVDREWVDLSRKLTEKFMKIDCTLTEIVGCLLKRIAFGKYKV